MDLHPGRSGLGLGNLADGGDGGLRTIGGAVGKLSFVASILERSQKYNLEHGITGILSTYSQGNVFIQVLEGARAAVNTLYGAIVRDPRHRDVTLLDYAEITERRFASWRMGSVNLNRVNLTIILRSRRAPVLDPFSMSGQRPSRCSKS